MSARTAHLGTESRFAALRRRFASQPERVLGPPDATGHIEMTLSEMAPGEYGHVLSICTCCEARQHLLELGFTPDAPIELVRVAPLGDPLTVRIRGYQLSLRRREADAVRVRRCPPELAWESEDSRRGE